MKLGKFKRLKQRLLKISKRVFNNNLALSLMITSLLIAVGVILAYENNKVVAVNNLAVAHYIAGHNKSLGFLANWDGANYISIALSGYRSIRLANFFPLYPLLIYLVHLVIGSPLYSALLISWAAFVGAVYYYIKITSRLFKLTDTDNKLRAVLPFILFPSAIWFMAAYTESLFAFLALGAIYYGFTHRYLLSGVMLAFLSLTNVNGLLVIALVAMIILEEGMGIWRSLITTAVGMSGILAYSIYLNVRFSKPLAFITAQQKHGWLVHSAGSLIGDLSFLHVIFIAALLTGVIYWWRKRKSFSIYCFFYILIPVIGGQFGGFERYCLMAFPLPLMVYSVLKKHNSLFTLTVALSAILWTYFLFQFSGGYIGG